MKLTRTQLRRLIMESIVSEATGSSRNIIKNLQKFGIQVFEGEQALAGYHVAMIYDVRKCARLLKSLGHGSRKINLGYTPCNRYLVSGRGLFEKYKAVTGKELRLYVTMDIVGGGKPVQARDTLGSSDIPMDLIIKSKGGDIPFSWIPGSSRGQFIDFDTGVHIHIKFRTENICNLNFQNFKKVDLNRYLRSGKKRKPAGPSLEYVQDPSTLSAPFEEDRPGPSSRIRPAEPPSYATDRKGRWLTIEELAANGINPASLPSKAKKRTAGHDFYWVGSEEFNLEKLINPEYDLD